MLTMNEHGSPVSLTEQLTEGEDHRLITAERAKEIHERLQTFRTGDGLLNVSVSAWWRGELRWARNEVTIANDMRDMSVQVMRNSTSGYGIVYTNQIDDASLRAAVRAAERKMMRMETPFPRYYDGLKWVPPQLPFPETAIWSDATFNTTPKQRSALASELAQGAGAQQLLSAGFLQMRVYETQAFWSTPGQAEMVIPEQDWVQGSGADRMARAVGYQRHTQAQCSMTVRHPKGVGSGWAGLSGYDWAVIDAKSLAKTALEKCVLSLNPVAIEPGRYTVILEPPALVALVDVLVASMQNRSSNEDIRFPNVWSLDVDPALQLRMTKLGLNIVDERITIRHAPMDPQLGIIPRRGDRDITWIENGVLRVLGYSRGDNEKDYALPVLGENLPELARDSYLMTGGETTMEEMIATTQRGLIVSRFSNVQSVPGAWSSLLTTGLTRDGLCLVENGKISRAVKNMRFTDSPLFVLNQLEQLGRPVPVFSPRDDSLGPRIVPPLKARDFAFTATIDAV